VKPDDQTAPMRQPLTRRQFLNSALGASTVLVAGGMLAGCSSSQTAGQAVHRGVASIRRGGTITVGVTAGANDTVTMQGLGDPDIARGVQLYEPLTLLNDDLSALEPVLAESIEPVRGGSAWVARLRQGVEFHNGKTMDADDVVFSLKRILNPKNPQAGAASISYVDYNGIKKLDATTVYVPLQYPNVNFPYDVGQIFQIIVPSDFGPANPVGTGPFKYKSFTPGQQSVFTRFENYWRTDQPYFDEVVIIDFQDPQARLNALLSGQIDAMSNLDPGGARVVQANPSLQVLNAETELFQPFCMRVDEPPFNDVRVRQAFRLIANRPQMVANALDKEGQLGNDLFSLYDPSYDHEIPQRHQDLGQAKSLLRQAGYSGLKVELVTAPATLGLVQAAQVFAQQALGAGVTVKVNEVTTDVLYGPSYLSWTFSQDYFIARDYLSQVAQSMQTDSPFNETHWNNSTYNKIINSARQEFDFAKRTGIIHEAQQIEWNEGGYIIPYFSNQVDAYNTKLTGFKPSRSGIPLGGYAIRAVGFLA
jgi:peptide/nickel transport system substrate-binding protein